MAALIQILNAVGALLLVYSFRYGKSIIVSPLVNAGGPVITILISLLLYRTIPNAINAAGMVAAAVAATVLMALEEEAKPANTRASAASPPLTDSRRRVIKDRSYSLVESPSHWTHG